MKIKPIAACLLTLATFCTAASAQDVDPGALVKAAQATVQQIDEGRAASVWDAMSAAVKTTCGCPLHWIISEGGSNAHCNTGQ